MLKIGLYERKRIRLVKDIGWKNCDTRTTLPAGWEGEIERLRPGSVNTVKEQFCICDCFLTDEYIRDLAR